MTPSTENPSGVVAATNSSPATPTNPAPTIHIHAAKSPERRRRNMGTITDTLTQTPSKKRNLVEMNWDPITRIVGSLGIFTKIDFENREVAECYSTSSLFRGYSIFMKGKDPRDAHF